MGLIKTFKIDAFPVIDGVFARGRDQYAIAIKKSNGNILLDKGENKPILKSPLVFIRGIIEVIEFIRLSLKMFLYSAEYFDNETPNDEKTEILSKEEFLNKQDRIKAEKSQSWIVFIGALLLVIGAILTIFIVPVFISSIFFDNVREDNWMLFNIVECVSRLVFVTLGGLIFSFFGGLPKRLRQYYSATNKAVNCFESGREVSLENVKNSSAFHPRSMIFVLYLTTIIFSVTLVFIKMENLALALLIRIFILVLSVNVAYEISKLLGMFNGKVSRIFGMLFGLWIEKFFISEMDDIQGYVAITAVNNSMIEG